MIHFAGCPTGPANQQTHRSVQTLMQQITSHFERGRVATVACEIENAIGGENLAVKMFVKKGRWVYKLLWDETEL